MEKNKGKMEPKMMKQNSYGFFTTGSLDATGDLLEDPQSFTTEPHMHLA